MFFRKYLTSRSNYNLTKTLTTHLFHTTECVTNQPYKAQRNFFCINDPLLLWKANACNHSQSQANAVESFQIYDNIKYKNNTMFINRRNFCNKKESNLQGDKLKKLEQEIASLEQRISLARHQYYSLRNNDNKQPNVTPSLTDDEFDALYNQLLHLQSLLPYKPSASSPTNQVANPLVSSTSDDGKVFPHTSTRMLGLMNAYNKADIETFVRRINKNIQKLKNETQASDNNNNNSEEDDEANYDANPLQYCDTIVTIADSNLPQPDYLNTPDNEEEALFTAELKYDGMAVSLTFEEGKLTRAVSRGDGAEGEDIRANVLHYVSNLPSPLSISSFSTSLSLPPKFEVRGEIVMGQHACNQFQQANLEKQSKDPSNSSAGNKSARNIVTGFMKRMLTDEYLRDEQQLISQYPKLKPKLDIICFSLYWLNEEGRICALPKTQWTTLQFLRAMKFTTDNSVALYDEEDLYQYIDHIESTQQKAKQNNEATQLQTSSSDYETDGIVFKLNDLATGMMMGSNARNPRSQIALKFWAEEAQTRLNGIQWQTTRTGKATPVALLNPVNLAGAFVGKATLHNFSFILENKIHIGSFVKVIRSGGVIPKINGVAFNDVDAIPISEESQFNCECKHNHLLERDGKDLYCNHPVCPKQLLHKINHFASSFGISGLSSQSVQLFLDHNLIENISDILFLKEEQLLSLPKWGQKKVDSLLSTIGKRKAEASLAEVLIGLGLPSVGKVASAKIAKAFPSISLLSDKDLTVEQLMQKAKVTQAPAEVVHKLFHSEGNTDQLLESARSTISRLREAGVLCLQ